MKDKSLHLSIFSSVKVFFQLKLMMLSQWRLVDRLIWIFSSFFFLDIKVSVIDGSSPFASAYDLENIIGSYRERNCELTKTCFVDANVISKENLIYLQSRWMYLMSHFTVYSTCNRIMFFLFLMWICTMSISQHMSYFHSDHSIVISRASVDNRTSCCFSL